MRRLQIGKEMNFADLKIVPIEEVSIHEKAFNESTFVHCTKKPYAILIIDTESKKIVDINDKELSLESMIKEVRGLQEYLLN